MTLPPLPEVFGNYALGKFTEVTPPPDISWLPQTVGWAWLGGAALLLLGRRAWFVLRRWYANRYRREATKKLQQLASEKTGAARVANVNRLIKLTALAAYPRHAVASLSGQKWVDFLNRQCDLPPFDATARQQLADDCYREQSADSADWQKLLASCQLWIDTHRGPSDD